MIPERRRLLFVEIIYDIVYANTFPMGGLTFRGLIAVRAIWHIQ
jgi:hypothetical protein